MPDENCGCGFWAYWQTPAAPEVSGKYTVAGIIEGYGPTLLGDLGFRSAKARIIALHCQFKIMTTVQPTRSRYLWTPDPGMFRRGPRGMDMFNQLTGREEARMVEDTDALLALQNMLEALYEVPVYGSMAAMLLRHPATTDYVASGSMDA